VKVAVSAAGGSLESPVDPRFGRCPYFVIVDTETMAFEVVPNTNISSPSGAGIGAAQIVVNKGVGAVLTGAIGPNAMQVLSQAGVKMVTDTRGSVRDVVENFRGGKLKSAPTAGYAMGGFLGRGGGRGMGRGMGRGRGMYPGPYQPPMGIEPSTSLNKEEEKEALAMELDELERRLSEVKKRLEELKR